MWCVSRLRSMRDRARNSIAGRKAQVAGSSFESWLHEQHEVAKRLGILAHVDKIDPPAVVRNGRVEFGEKTVSDWVGMLDGGSARYLAEEQKSTLKEYLPRAEVSKKQQEHLSSTARGRGLALLLVEFRGELSDRLLHTMFPPVLYGHAQHSPRRYCVPWHSTPWQVLKTAESVSEESLRAGGWAVRGECFLERFHPRGTPSTPARQRSYPRE